MIKPEEHHTVGNLFSHAAERQQGLFGAEAVRLYEGGQIELPESQSLGSGDDIGRPVPAAQGRQRLRLQKGQPLRAGKGVKPLPVQLRLFPEKAAEALNDALDAAYIISLGDNK